MWVTVVNKPCPEGSFRSPGRNGECVCTGFTIDVGGKCVPGAILVPSIVVPVVVLLALAAYIFDRRRTKAARAQWTIHPEELLFDDPYTVCIPHLEKPLASRVSHPRRELGMT